MLNYAKMNPIQAGALAQANFEAAIKEMQPDYNIVSTFASDFAIADACGIEAIKSTFEVSFKNFKHDVYMMAEMSLVLNWAIWRYWELHNQELSLLYDEIWHECDNWCMDNFNGDELQFYLQVTD